jgi:hypothetical protein
MSRSDFLCSFCRKQPDKVGPLIEGSGSVFICRNCVESCTSILDQEERRRRAGGRPAPRASDPAQLEQRLTEMLGESLRATAATLAAFACRLRANDGPGGEARRHILATGPSRASRLLLARTLAIALELPFVQANRESIQARNGGMPAAFFLELLEAAEYEADRAGRGIVCVEGLERPEVQWELLRIWNQPAATMQGRSLFSTERMIYLCGGEFSDRADPADRAGPADADRAGESLRNAGVLPELMAHVGLTLPVPALDEAAQIHLVSRVGVRSHLTVRERETGLPADRGVAGEEPGGAIRVE